MQALIVSTQETLFGKTSDWQPDFSGDRGARVWFPDLIKEGEWHHVVVVFNRQILKNTTFSLYGEMSFLPAAKGAGQGVMRPGKAGRDFYLRRSQQV